MPNKTHLRSEKKHGLSSEQSYKDLLQELKGILSQGKYAAYKAVDNIRVQTYWQLGERIVREELNNQERAEYGKYLIKYLSKDLGIYRRDLYRIIKLYQCYTNVGSLTPQLSWTHYYRLVDIDNEKKRLFYQSQAVIHSWSVRELKRQIKANLYENTFRQDIESVFITKLPAADTRKVFKNTYDFRPFIELQSDKSEKDLENKILANFEMFLCELGEDFS